MLNFIWLALIVLAVLIGGFEGKLKEVGDKAFEMAEFSVLKTAFPLIGIMALWLGIMRLAERAGLVALLARGLRPIMRRLFPDVPVEHPAMGSMLMNIAANMLGLGNAATPLGLRAMKDLESLNRHPGTATNAMCTFLAINTSGIQLIPVTAIAIFAANKSTNPTAIVGTAIMATACAATGGVIMAKILERLRMFRLPGGPLTPALSPSAGERENSGQSPSESEADDRRMTVEKSRGERRLSPLPRGGGEGQGEGERGAGAHPTSNIQPPTSNAPLTPALSPSEGEREAARPPEKKSDAAADKEKAPVKEAATLQPLQWWGMIALAAYLGFFVWLFLRFAFPTLMGLPLSDEAAKQTLFVRIVDSISKLSIPFLLSALPLYAGLRRVKVYEEFVDGAKEGFDVAIRIVPYLVAMLVAIGMFRAAGGIDMVSRALGPVMNAVGFPPDLLPMCLMRPLSGSGTLGMFTELVQHFGADSLLARTAGTIYGSTETTFYVLAVYFGSVGVKRTRHAVAAGLTADAVGVIASIIICRLVFGT